MTVAFDVGPLRGNPAGVGVYVRSLAQGLAELGRSDVVYIGRRADAIGLPQGVTSLHRSSRMPYPLWVQFQAARSVARARGDIAHYTDGLVPLVGRGRTVVTVLDLSLVAEWRSHRVLRYPRIPLILAAPRLADRIVAISQATADEIIRLAKVAAGKIDVIPLAPRASARPMSDAAVDATLERFGLARGGFLLVPGTIEPRKNHVRVVEAFQTLVRRGAIPLDMTLVLAGGRGWRSDRALAAIAASPARGRIKLLGYVDEDDLASLMTSSAAVVYASTYEGFGLPVLEAMACGAAVVTSNVSSMPEVAGDAGVLVDPFDPGAIAAGIETALGADAAVRRRSISHAGTFTWAATAAATSRVYDSLA